MPDSEENIELSKWKETFLKFLNALKTNNDAEPFMQPVDANHFPLYYKVISEPMDFSCIEKNLNNNVYKDPIEAREDVRLIFKNAKVFNRNPSSPIRLMAKRLSIYCEEKLREIIVDWQRLKTYLENTKNGKRCRAFISRQQLWIPTESYF